MPTAHDVLFRTLADPTRRAILARLARGEASVAELAEPFAMSQPAVSKHLKVLERAGLITVGQDAQRRPRRFEGKPLAEASAWLERYRATWEANFKRLDGVLEGPTALVFAWQDPAQPAKILRGFARTSRILQIKAAVMEGQILDAEQVTAIADLPSRDELVAKVVGGISSPLYGIVTVLSGPVRSLAYVLQARKEQLEQAA